MPRTSYLSEKIAGRPEISQSWANQALFDEIANKVVFDQHHARDLNEHILHLLTIHFHDCLLEEFHLKLLFERQFKG
jgi:hypothetical protein